MVKYSGLTPNRITLYRNLKSTLTLATDQLELTADDLHYIPMRLRPPSLRRDHWQPFFILDHFQHQLDLPTKLLTELRQRDMPIPRNHRTYDPIMTKLWALYQAFQCHLPSLDQEPNLKAHWEYMDLKNQFIQQYQVCFPKTMSHHLLKPELPPYVARIQEYWKNSDLQ